jgi:hypothetical protein
MNQSFFLETANIPVYINEQKLIMIGNLMDCWYFFYVDRKSKMAITTGQ